MQQLETFVEAIRAQLAAANLCGGNVVKSPNRPSKDPQVPQARVFSGHDDAKPYGSGRVNQMRFAHTTSLVVEVIDVANGGEDLKARLCTKAEAVLASLLRNTAWGGTVLEGIGGFRLVFDQPVEGNHVLGRVQVQIDALWTSEWDPSAVATDDFTTLGVDAGGGIGSTIAVPQ